MDTFQVHSEGPSTSFHWAPCLWTAAWPPAWPSAWPCSSGDCSCRAGTQSQSIRRPEGAENKDHGVMLRFHSTRTYTGDMITDRFFHKSILAQSATNSAALPLDEQVPLSSRTSPVRYFIPQRMKTPCAILPVQEQRPIGKRKSSYCRTTPSVCLPSGFIHIGFTGLFTTFL